MFTLFCSLFVFVVSTSMVIIAISTSIAWASPAGPEIGEKNLQQDRACSFANMQACATPPDRMNPDALFAHGQAFEFGNGVVRDSAEAAMWYRAAADRGDVRAQNSLGIMYDQGIGVPQNPSEAVKWFLLSADRGFPIAQVNLGHMIESGRGVTQDNGKAFAWFLIAAQQGEPQAQYHLAVMYEWGTGIAKDGFESFHWYKEAAKLGHPYAQIMVVYHYLRGDIVERDVTEAFKCLNTMYTKPPFSEIIKMSAMSIPCLIFLFSLLKLILYSKNNYTYSIPTANIASWNYERLEKERRRTLYLAYPLDTYTH
jgi:TPR repeat protein